MSEYADKYNNLTGAKAKMEELIKKQFFARLKEQTYSPLSVQYKYRYLLLLGAFIAFFPTFIFLFYSVFDLK